MNRRGVLRNATGFLVATMLSLVVSAGIITQTRPRHFVSSGGAAQLVFGDDFEARSAGSSPQFTAPPIAVGAAEWGPEDGGAASAVEISSPGLASDRALRFRYLAGNTQAEQRYVLDTTGAQQYRELWAEYDFFVPANWVTPSSLDNNNKFFFFYNDDTGNQSYFDFEMISYADGMYITHQMKRNTVNVANGFINADNGNGHGELYPLIDEAVDPGTWIGIRIHVRMDTAASYAGGTPAADRGIAEVFKRTGADWVQIWRRVSETGLAADTGDGNLPRYNSFNAGTNGGGFSHNHMSGGYIMGAQNATYSVDTDYLIDNFKIYSTNPGWGN